MAKLLLIAGAVYALFVGLIYLTQHRLLYLPHIPGRSLNMTPADIGLGYDDVELRASDGVRLHGWFVPGAGPKVLLFLHGNAGNISHRLASIRQWIELGVSVLIIDYRGYGESGGRPTEAGTYLDAEAAWAYLVRDRSVRPEDIVVFGRSLGGPIAGRLAATHDPAELIIESAFTSVPDIASELYRFIPARYLSRYQYDTRGYVRDVRCPVLIVHSRDDEIIPFEHGAAIFAAAPEPRALLELEGSHNEAPFQSGARYLEGLRSFLDSL